ncbi:MAG: hypothetical protein IPF54_08915 [Draconibacterium sp.]|nr:hypothetical protein [Draconibacterium sp.]
MTKRLLNTGFVSCLMIIFLQIFAGFYELMQLKVLYLQYFINGLNSILNILILSILWKILVKLFKQKQLDFILKTIVVIMIAASLLSFNRFLHLGKLVTISLIIASLINLILYFIFIFKLVEIDKSEIRQIEQLKNYSLAFVICVFGQLILNIVIELNRIKGLDYISHLYVLIPIIFIGMFFLKTKYDIEKR